MVELENFKYRYLNLELPSALPEGSFAYGHSSLKENTPSEGAWFDEPWFDDWFGPDEDFTYQHLR